MVIIAVHITGELWGILPRSDTSPGQKVCWGQVLQEDEGSEAVRSRLGECGASSLRDDLGQVRLKSWLIYDLNISLNFRQCTPVSRTECDTEYVQKCIQEPKRKCRTDQVRFRLHLRYVFGLILFIMFRLSSARPSTLSSVRQRLWGSVCPQWRGSAALRTSRSAGRRMRRTASEWSL